MYLWHLPFYLPAAPRVQVSQSGVAIGGNGGAGGAGGVFGNGGNGGNGGSATVINTNR